MNLHQHRLCAARFLRPVPRHCFLRQTDFRHHRRHHPHDFRVEKLTGIETLNDDHLLPPKNKDKK
jgi:hypothetical protein